MFHFFLAIQWAYVPTKKKKKISTSYITVVVEGVSYLLFQCLNSPYFGISQEFKIHKIWSSDVAINSKSDLPKASNDLIGAQLLTLQRPGVWIHMRHFPDPWPMWERPVHLCGNIFGWLGLCFIRKNGKQEKRSKPLRSVPLCPLTQSLTPGSCLDFYQWCSFMM